MKRILMAITLACLLSGTALAGEMPAVDAPAPAPSGAQSSAVVRVLLTIIRVVVR